MVSLQSFLNLQRVSNSQFAAVILYILKDTFTTSVAAGSVNGTTAQPTGQTRTVTDTNTKISITGGQLSFATGEAISDGVWYPSVTRLGGKMLLGIINISVSNGANIGWDINSSGVISDAIRLASSNTLQIIRAGSSLSVGTFTNSINYSVCFIARLAGVYFYIKGGTEFPNWTLIWIDTTDNSASVFASINASTATAVFTADNIRIPSNLYLPTPLAYDTFTRANGAIGSTESVGPDSQNTPILLWTGSTWTIATNVAVNTPVTLGSDVIVNGAFAADTDWTKGAGWTISGGVAVASATSADLTATVAPLVAGMWYKFVWTVLNFSAGTVKLKPGGNNLANKSADGTYTEYFYANTSAFAIGTTTFTGNVDNVSAKALTWSELFSSITTSTKDVIADVNITKSNGLNSIQSGLVLNLDSAATPQNYVLAFHDGAGLARLDKYVAGVRSGVINGSVTYAAGATLRVIKDGTNYQLFYNNIKVGSTSTISDAGIINNTLHGMFSVDPNDTLDNFSLFPRGATANEYAALDVY